MYGRCFGGFISSTILKLDQVLLSDRAGQFALFNPAACWVHMERPLRKIICTSPEMEKQLADVRNTIWTLYDNLKETTLTGVGKELVHQLYNDDPPDLSELIRNRYQTSTG